MTEPAPDTLVFQLVATASAEVTKAADTPTPAVSLVKDEDK